MEKDIGKINKNDTTDIVLRIDDFADRLGLTIREFVTSERYTGFTKSGVRISPENFSKFKEMINSISEEVLSEPAEEDTENKEQEKLDASEENSDEEVKVEKPGELPDY